MNISIYTPAYSEPVSLVEMKNHLKADADITTDDELIKSLTTAARDVVETGTGANVERSRVMLATTFDLTLDSFPGCLHIEVPRVPLIAVTSITYVDLDGNRQTLSSSLYSITDAAKGIISLGYQQSWPNARYQPAAVTVRFTAGMAATFTASTNDTCTTYGRTFANADRAQVLNSGGALPTGLSALTAYYIVSASGATFSLSATSGGGAIDITGAVSGTNFIGLDLIGFETLRSAMKLLVGHWYFNRAAVSIGNGIVSTIPMAVESLIASQHA